MTICGVDKSFSLCRHYNKDLFNNYIYLLVQTNFQSFDFERLFPLLVDFHVEGLWDDPEPLNMDNLVQVTKITEGFLSKSPFEVLSNLPCAKVVEMTSSRYTDFNLQPFELQSLTDLNLDCYQNKWTLGELKAAFAFFPNLSKLFLKLRGLKNDYNEQVT